LFDETTLTNLVGQQKILQAPRLHFTLSLPCAHILPNSAVSCPAKVRSLAVQKGGDGLLLGFGRVRWAAPSLSTKLSSSCVFTGCPSQLLHENILQPDVTESAAHFSDDSLFRCKAHFIAGGLLTASVLRHGTPQLVIKYCARNSTPRRSEY